MTFTEFPLEEFHRRGALWAANFFVLWPLGLALAVDVEVIPVDPVSWCGESVAHEAHPAGDSDTCRGAHAAGEVTHLTVQHYVYPEGELEETIDEAPEVNNQMFRTFLGYVHERIVSMKLEERQILLGKYERFEMASPEQILLAVGDE